MERKIRADKRECMMLQAADDKEGLKEAAVRLRQDKSKYTDYCKAHGLGVHNENTQVYGYDRKASVKTLWAEYSDLTNKDYNDIIDKRGTLSDMQARMWYKAHDAKIPDMIDRSKTHEEQARQACDLRNQFRTQTRELMKDQEKREYLDRTYPNKSFEELLEHKMSDKGMTYEQAVDDILKTATKTRASVDAMYDLDLL